MSHGMRNSLGLAAVSLILVAASALPARAAQQPAPSRPGVPSAQVRPNPLPLPTVYPPYNPTRPIGGDWWRIYPWSPYNAWRNPYWYPPYNNNYPFPPYRAYPYNPYLMPQPYPVPQPVPVPFPWGNTGSDRR